jgi:hypothetical protein
MITRADRRRAVIQDLLICVGLPILQIISRECALSFTVNGCLQELNPEYIVSTNRYNIFEDFGPAFSSAVTPLTLILFNAWPVAIGIVSLFYCGEYHGLPCFPFHALAHQFQSRPSTHSTSANVSSGRVPKVSVVADTSALWPWPPPRYLPSFHWERIFSYPAPRRVLDLGKAGPPCIATIQRFTRSQASFGGMTEILLSASRCFAGY